MVKFSNYFDKKYEINGLFSLLYGAKGSIIAIYENREGELCDL